MKQYHDLLDKILNEGTLKPAARENMPGTISLFGPQMEFDLNSFPILTTKKVFFKHIVTELLWFLRGDTNVKYLIDNNCSIWNEDAYNYYKKKCVEYGSIPMEFKDFIENIKSEDPEEWNDQSIYKMGDCGHQYGKTWTDFGGVDQIQRVVNSLKHNPQSRRHIVSSVDVGNDDDLALYWCHSMFQFNARPIDFDERCMLGDNDGCIPWEGDWDDWLENNSSIEEVTKILNDNNIPEYYLDCKMYQRSADVFLGVPYNFSSYSLLTLLIAKIVNMEPGKFIHTFGDVHIYENHLNQVNEILENNTSKYKQPKLKFSDKLLDYIGRYNGDITINGTPDFGYKDNFSNFISQINPEDIYLENYKSYPSIKAKLSTGLK